MVEDAPAPAPSNNPNNPNLRRLATFLKYIRNSANDFTCSSNSTAQVLFYVDRNLILQNQKSRRSRESTYAMAIIAVIHWLQVAPLPPAPGFPLLKIDKKSLV